MCGCSKSSPPTNPIPQSLLSSSGNFTQESIKQAVDTNDKTMMVTVEYSGPQKETFTVKSRVDPTVMYRFGNNDFHRTRAVFVGDAVYLMGLSEFYRVVSNVVGVQEANDVSAFMGEPIVA